MLRLPNIVQPWPRSLLWEPNSSSSCFLFCSISALFSANLSWQHCDERSPDTACLGSCQVFSAWMNVCGGFKVPSCIRNHHPDKRRCIMGTRFYMDVSTKARGKFLLSSKGSEKGLLQLSWNCVKLLGCGRVSSSLYRTKKRLDGKPAWPNIHYIWTEFQSNSGPRGLSWFNILFPGVFLIHPLKNPPVLATKM